MRIYAIKTNPHFFLQSIVKQRFTKIVASKKQGILAQIQTLFVMASDAAFNQFQEIK